MSLLHSRTPVILLFILVLSACNLFENDGHGIQTGQFVDSPVSGLNYSTPTLSGITNANGEFQYRFGETVSFYIGDIVLGQATGAQTISPFDLAGITPPKTKPEIQSVINQIKRHRPNISFEVATNIAVFLQTVDEDGDAANGIQIPALMQNLAAGINLNFLQTIRDFFYNPSFHQLLDTGRTSGLWGGSRVIHDPNSALDSMYAGLGINPEIEVMTSKQFDTNDDGVVDKRWTNSYDSEGRVISKNYDNDADGVVDGRETSTYDANGNWVLSEYDSDLDDVLDGRYTSAYDKNGIRIMYEWDDDGDGNVDHRNIYSNNGQLSLVEDDGNDDGVVDNRYIYTYDADDNLVLLEEDNNNDGVIDYVHTFTFDVHGNQILWEMDREHDGVVDWVIFYEYNQYGHKILEEQDTDNNGIIDQRKNWHYKYDADGNIIIEEIDSDGDGAVDSRTTYVYDDLGNLVLEEIDSDADSSINKRMIFDANGNLTLEEEDTDGDGTIDSRKIFTYTYAMLGHWQIPY